MFEYVKIIIIVNVIFNFVLYILKEYGIKVYREKEKLFWWYELCFFILIGNKRELVLYIFLRYIVWVKFILISFVLWVSFLSLKFCIV